MKAIAFWVLVSWIALISILISLMIWNIVDRDWVMRIIWTATTLTVGTLLIFITHLGFESATLDAERRQREESSPERDQETAAHLREAMERAKQDAGTQN